MSRNTLTEYILAMIPAATTWIQISERLPIFFRENEFHQKKGYNTIYNVFGYIAFKSCAVTEYLNDSEMNRTESFTTYS